jgi:hypothetical protein
MIDSEEARRVQGNVNRAQRRVEEQHHEVPPVSETSVSSSRKRGY